MDFKTKVADSFQRIKEDIDDIKTKTKLDRDRIDSSDDKFAKIFLLLENLNKKVDKLTQNMSHAGKEINGKSSTGNKPHIKRVSTGTNKQENPLVSHGTSPKREIKETKRSIKIKNTILEKAKEKPYLSTFYKEIVNIQELCSKTSFYRFINELSQENKVKIYLDNNKRRIRTKD